MNEQLRQDLQRTLDFLRVNRWTRGSLARRGKSVPGNLNRTSPLSPEAKSFCFLGAFMKANDVRLSSPKVTVFERSVLAETGRSPEHYNDHVAKDKRYIIRLLARMVRKA